MSEVPEKLSMSSVRDNLALAAGPRDWGDTRQSWLSRAARRAGVSYRTAKSIWYGETRDPKSSIEQRIRAAAERERAKRDRCADADRLLNMATALEYKDAEMHREDIEAFRAFAHRLIGQD